MAKNIPTLSEMIANLRQSQPNPGFDTVAQGVVQGLDVRAAREQSAKEAELKNVLDQAKMRLQERETGAKELSAQADFMRALPQPEKPVKPNYSIQETSKGLVAVNTANPTDVKDLGFITPKQQATAEAKANKLASAKERAKIIVDTTTRALNKVNAWTTGKGSAIKDIPILGRGTDAANLAGDIKTIQATLGFEQLQRMRDESPTGGALGQIAVKELEFLQAALANLETEQGEAQVRDNLNRVKTHYQNWLNAVEQANAQEGGMSPVPQTQSPVQSGGFKVTARRPVP